MLKLSRAARGFTLIEITAAVGILGGLAAAALPLANSLQVSRAQDELSSAFASAVHSARAAALADGLPVELCPSRDGSHCDSAEWGAGWRLYRGDATLASYQPEQALPLVLRNSAGDAADALSFNAQGFTAGDRAYAIATCLAGKPVGLTLERSGRLVRAAHSDAAITDSACAG